MLTRYGARVLLAEPFRAAQGLSFVVGLCDTAPSRDLVDATGINEPTVGVNGYQRVALTRGLVDWAAIGDVNAEDYVESKLLTFTAAGGLFDKPSTRLFLADNTNKVICFGSPFPLVQIGPSTPLSERQFKFRVYLR